MNGNQVGTYASPLDPLVGPLQFNGGPTQTRAPLAGSPVINAAATFGIETHDQRGLGRPIDMIPDIGAVESEGPTISLCNGDGGDGMGCTDCPCGNNAIPSTVGGCLNSAGASARLERNGIASVSLPPENSIDLRFRLTGAAPNSFALLTSADAVTPTSPANPCFGSSSGIAVAAFDGLDCTGGGFRRHGVRSTNSLGSVGTSNAPWGGEGRPTGGIPSGFNAGQTSYFQVVYRDSAFATCLAGLNTSQAIEIQFTP